MKSSKILIEYQCPKCGAPATLGETDHLFTCEFCKVKSFLLSQVYRYILPDSAPEDKELVYFPYWRFKGMLFSCLSDEIRDRIVDVSYRAVETEYFPVSVGMRSQTMKLRFMTPESKGHFLHPTVSRKEMIEIIEERYQAGLPKPIFLQSFIGEALSLLYSPYYVEKKIIDAILNEPVPCELPDDFDPASLSGGPPDWQLQFIPAQCPDCGWDLDGERDSLTLSCRNCRSLYQSGRKKFLKLKYAHLPTEEEDVTYLPFWRIRSDISGVQLDTYADLVRLANLPKVVQKEWEERTFYFWAPAFKVRPEDFLRFSRNLTLFQPLEKLEPRLPEGELFPVTLPVMEAVQSLKLNLAGFMKPQSLLLPKLPEINIDPRAFILIYIPFARKGSELSYPDFKLRINSNLLKYARHLQA